MIFDFTNVSIYLKPGVTEYVEKSQMLRSTGKMYLWLVNCNNSGNFSTFDLAVA